MTKSGKRIIQGLHDAVSMATEQQTIEAVARQMHDLRNPIVLWEESSINYREGARLRARDFIKIAQSLDWKPPQPTCSTCRHWRMQPNTSNAEVPWGECWLDATLERLPAMFGNESCSSHSQPPQKKDN